MVTEVSKAAAILSNSLIIKMLKSKEAAAIVDVKTWPTLLDSDDSHKRKLQTIYRAPTAEMICFLDFSVSTTGMLAGVKVC
jgi:hypothetical protein